MSSLPAKSWNRHLLVICNDNDVLNAFLLAVPLLCWGDLKVFLYWKQHLIAKMMIWVCLEIMYPQKKCWLRKLRIYHFPYWNSHELAYPPSSRQTEMSIINWLDLYFIIFHRVLINWFRSWITQNPWNSIKIPYPNCSNCPNIGSFALVSHFAERPAPLPRPRCAVPAPLCGSPGGIGRQSSSSLDLAMRRCTRNVF